MIESRSMYTFQQALDARFQITDDASSHIRSAAYVHKNDFPILPHYHSFYEINIIIEGEGTHQLTNNKFPARKGDVFFVPPNITHGYTENENSQLKIFHVLLSNEFMKENETVLKGMPGYSLLFNIEPDLRQNGNIKIFPCIDSNEFIFFLHEINKLTSFCRSDKLGKQYESNRNTKILNLVGDLALVLTSSFTDDTNIDSVGNIKDILKIIDYIESNYSENITLQTLCNVANMSRSSLHKQFSLLCKCTPSQYLTNIRIDKACKMLTDSDLSISQIAQDCGFFDSSHFSKTFLQLKQMLPKEYRSSRYN